MSTTRQIEANRRNARLSTGPRTPQGKAAVSLNSLRHGLRARRVVLPGEKQEDFQRLCDDLEAEWQPQSRTEQFYLEQMAASWWKLARMEATEVGICKLQLDVVEHVPLLDRIWQAQSRMERSYARAQRELERLQQSRSEPCAEPVEPASAPEHPPEPAEEIPGAGPGLVMSPDASEPQPPPNSPDFIVPAVPPIPDRPGAPVG